MAKGIAVDKTSWRPSSPLLIAVAAALLSLGMSLWQLSVPEFLSFYDSGVYMAATIHFVSGAMPYRDFVFVQPPGLLLILSPIGVVSRLFGSHDGLIVGRVAGAVITGLNAGLLAWLVRYRGRFAMAVAGLGLALLPVASYVSSSVKLEPYCICLSLVGAVVAFPHPDRTTTPSTRRLIVIGILFGVGAIVKLWAFFPFIAIIAALLPSCRRRVLTVVAAAGTTFVVGCLPFFIAAPHNFVSQVFVEQLSRKSNLDVALLTRLVDLTGFYGTSLAPSHVEALVSFIVFIGLVAYAFRRSVKVASLDIFFVVAATVSVLGLLASSEFYLYYGYFSAPFLVGVLAISLAHFQEPARAAMDRLHLSRNVGRLAARASLASGIVLVFALTLYVTTFYTNYAWAWGLYGKNLSAITNTIPAGSCVVYDYVIYGVYSNRGSSNPHCPDVVDPNGMWMGWGFHLGATPKGLSLQWQGDFERAQYVVLNQPHTSYVAWDSGLTSWFAKNYHMIYGHDYVYIYANDSLRGA